MILPFHSDQSVAISASIVETITVLEVDGSQTVVK